MGKREERDRREHGGFETRGELLEAVARGEDAETEAINAVVRERAERFSGETPLQRAERLEAVAAKIRANAAANAEARAERERKEAEAAAARERDHEARLDAALAGDRDVALHAFLAEHPERDEAYFMSKVWPHRRRVLLAQRSQRDLDRMRASGKYQPY